MQARISRYLDLATTAVVVQCTAWCQRARWLRLRADELAGIKQRVCNGRGPLRMEGFAQRAEVPYGIAGRRGAADVLPVVDGQYNCFVSGDAGATGFFLAPSSTAMDRVYGGRRMWS